MISSHNLPIFFNHKLYPGVEVTPYLNIERASITMKNLAPDLLRASENQPCTLLKMPYEIIELIYKLLDADDVENFAGSDHLLYQIGQKELRIHHERRERYQRVNIGRCDDLDVFGSIEAMLLDCRLSQYPIHVQVVDFGMWGFVGNDFDQDVTVCTKDINSLVGTGRLHQIAKRLEGCGLSSAEASKITAGVEQADNASILGALLSMMPCMTSLALASTFWTSRTFSNILQALTRVAATSCSKNCQVFNRLRDVIITNEQGLNMPVLRTFDILGLFAKIPTVRVLKGYAVSEVGPSGSSWEDIDKGSSNVEELVVTTIWDCAVEMTRCMPCFKSLK